MSAANVLTSSFSITRSSKWIISQRDDLVWFIGSSLAGYLALGLTWGANYQPSTTVFTFVWAILISGPHFYATATRTYFDRDQRKKLRGLLWFILPLCFLPILLTTIGGRTLVLVFGAAWGTFHISKQHVGIMMLYKRVNDERSKTDFRLDKWFLLISQTLPLLLFLFWLSSFSALARLSTVAILIQVGLAAGYLWRQIMKYRNDEEMNWPKLMLLALVIPLHWLAFFSASSMRQLSGVFVFTIVVNFGHALQYHRLTWFHNRNRYQGRPGLSGFLSRSVIYYYTVSLTLYLLAVFLMPELLLSVPIYMHYILDARIWRVRNDPELAHALRLGPPVQATG